MADESAKMRRKRRLKIKRVRKRTNVNSKSEECILEVEKTKRHPDWREQNLDRRTRNSIK